MNIGLLIRTMHVRAAAHVPGRVVYALLLSDPVIFQSFLLLEVRLVHCFF